MAEEQAAIEAGVDDMKISNNMAPIYVSDKLGNDQGGDGTKKAPFKTVLQAMRSVGAEPFPEIMVDRKDGETGFELIAKAQLKKMTKLFGQEKRKLEEQKKREAEKAIQHEKNLEEAKSIVIEEDKTLPAPTQIKIRDTTDHRDQRVKIHGWVHRLRQQESTRSEKVRIEEL